MKSSISAAVEVVTPVTINPSLAVTNPTESILVTSSYVNVPPTLTLPVNVPVDPDTAPENVPVVPEILPTNDVAVTIPASPNWILEPTLT